MLEKVKEGKFEGCKRRNSEYVGHVASEEPSKALGFVNRVYVAESALDCVVATSGLHHDDYPLKWGHRGPAEQSCSKLSSN